MAVRPQDAKQRDGLHLGERDAAALQGPQEVFLGEPTAMVRGRTGPVGGERLEERGAAAGSVGFEEARRAGSTRSQAGSSGAGSAGSVMGTKLQRSSEGPVVRDRTPAGGRLPPVR